MKYNFSFQLSSGRVIQETAYSQFLLVMSAEQGTPAEQKEMAAHFTSITGKQPIDGETARCLLQVGKEYAANKVREYLAK